MEQFRRPARGSAQSQRSYRQAVAMIRDEMHMGPVTAHSDPPAIATVRMSARVLVGYGRNVGLFSARALTCAASAAVACLSRSSISRCGASRVSNLTASAIAARALV